MPSIQWFRWCLLRAHIDKSLNIKSNRTHTHAQTNLVFRFLFSIEISHIFQTVSVLWFHTPHKIQKVEIIHNHEYSLLAFSPLFCSPSSSKFTAIHLIDSVIFTINVRSIENIYEFEYWISDKIIVSLKLLKSHPQKITIVATYNGIVNSSASVWRCSPLSFALFFRFNRMHVK